MHAAFKTVSNAIESAMIAGSTALMRALAQAAVLVFGLPRVFRAPEEWTTSVKGEVFDLVQCSQRIHTGEAANTSQAPHSLVDRPKRWAQWVFSMNSLWQEDSPMPDRPLTVHCSGLGGGLLSPDHDYDLFFQNHAQMKVYGPFAGNDG